MRDSEVSLARQKIFTSAYTIGDLKIEALTKLVPVAQGTAKDQDTVRHMPVSVPRVRWLEREKPKWMT